MRYLGAFLVMLLWFVAAIMLYPGPAAEASSPLNPPTPVVDLTPTPTPELGVEETSDDITKDIVGLVPLAGLMSFASAIAMVFSYFNVVPDGKGGVVYLGLGAFTYLCTLFLPAVVYNPLFEFLDLLGRMVLLALTGIGLHAGAKYLNLKPQRRGYEKRLAQMIKDAEENPQPLIPLLESQVDEYGLRTEEAFVRDQKKNLSNIGE